MFDGLIMFGNAVVGYLNPLSLALAFGATLLGVVAGCMPGLSATLVITLLTTLDAEDAGQPGDPGAGLRL